VILVSGKYNFGKKDKRGTYEKVEVKRKSKKVEKIELSKRPIR